MSDYPKYRLKKDTPEFKAGSVFTRCKYDYGDYGDDCLFAGISPGVSPVPSFDISLIDNFDEWFEEVKEAKEPKWVRKQIKQVKYRIPDGKRLNNDYIEITWRYIKDYYYLDSEWGIAMYYKKGFIDRLDVENTGENDDVGSKTIDAANDRLINLANQLVRDGYIEIEDNPNIVWEDEND